MLVIILIDPGQSRDFKVTGQSSWLQDEKRYTTFTTIDARWRDVYFWLLVEDILGIKNAEQPLNGRNTALDPAWELQLTVLPRALAGNQSPSIRTPRYDTVD